MSNAELWDLDTSGGIMEQIQLLVAPPVSADALRRSRRRRERDVYRRPGRAVNHDCCDSCKEGGDLICCDRCPAAFHLMCHDPPLVEEELPTGEWLCHRCKISPQETKDDDAESNSSKSSNRSFRGKRFAAAASDSDGKRSTGNLQADGDAEHPLKTLAKAARLMNPVQFDLGKEISCTKPLPGSSKRVYGKPVRHLPKKQAHELDNGLVPLPAKTCFTCSKSCRVAPLIQCDYCPLLFHLDCLNPPLTSLPTGRWMCPNHVEHFLDSCLLRSQSLTERLRLWDRYTGLVNSHTVKVDFLNKIHRKYPPFRFKRKLPARPTVSVPPAIKHFYQNPPALLPDLPRHILPTTATNDLPGARGPPLATLEEQEEWLSSVVSMQASIAKYLAQKQLQRSSDSGHKLTDSALPMSKPTASVAPVVYKDMEVSPAPALPLLNSDPVQKACVATSAHATADFLDCDDDKQQNSNSLLNGEQKSALNVTALQDDRVNSGSEWVLDTSARSSVSLLLNHIASNVNGGNNSSSASTVNGDVDMLEVQNSGGLEVQKQELGSLQRSRSNSIDSVSSPCVGAAGSQWFSGDNINGDKISGIDGCKNVVINTVNSSTVVTKILPGKPQPAKVILPSKTSVLSSSINVNSVGTQSQRISVQPQTKTQTTSVTTGSASKVITVSATPSGRTVNNVSAAANKNNNINSIVGSSSTFANLNTLLQQWIEGNAVDSEFSKIDDQLTYILAWQRLQQLMPSKSPPRSSTPSSSATVSAQSSSSLSTGKKGLLNVYLSQQNTSEVRSRAVLCPLTGKGQAVPMPYRCLTLGTGADMDVCLSHFGHCNFVSGHHATIFYDEMSRHFELLNYSEHGTTVDNVLYSCDFSDKPATTLQPCLTVAAVREIINKGGNNKNGSKISKAQSEEVEQTGTLDKEKPRMSARANEMYVPCNCKVSSSSLIVGNGAGWEGTALLYHGSYIRVGCLQFVFSIVDHAPGQPVRPISAESSQPPSSAPPATTRFSSMPLLSSSQYLHNQPSVSLLKTHLKSTALP